MAAELSRRIDEIQQGAAAVAGAEKEEEVSKQTIEWLRGLAAKGGKGAVNNIDARCLGTEISRLQEAKRRAAAIADERSKENVALRAEIERLRAALKPLADIPLWRDTYPDAEHDRIDGPDLATTAAQVRAARDALEHSALSGISD